MGRLGNQLFQVAATLSQAHKMGIGAAFNKWEYKDWFLHPVDDSLEADVMRVGGKDHSLVTRLKFGYSALPAGNNQCLLGFFQSPKYISMDPAVEKHFLPGNDLMKRVREAGSSFIHRMNTCAIHVRRTDYLEKAGYHPPQPIEYYEKAIYEMEHKHGTCNFLVFSDDMDWCRSNFSKFQNKNIEFANKNSDIVDLYLMAHCRHFIIANSSFSWWGAYLHHIVSPETADQSTVIAPENWCGPEWKAKSKDDVWTDIYLPNWTVI